MTVGQARVKPYRLVNKIRTAFGRDNAVALAHRNYDARGRDHQDDRLARHHTKV